ncbi:MAG: hypothetical protein E7318_02995 [Clostridiales bacterium]|nr:hypothetical protein [Clostridiales bacterium]
MGYTFAAALVKKTGGTAPATRKAFREEMETLGYRRAASAEEASLSLRMYQDKKSAWLSLALEMPEDLDKELEFLRKVAAEMHTPILYFMNFDSDFLYVAATDGKDVQHVHVGFIDEDDEAMTDSEDLSIFDALLPDDAAREEFRRILAVDDEERVFSEEAAQEMATLFGYTPEVLFIDEDAKPFAEFNFDLPGEEAVPFLMPEDAPVAFEVTCGHFNVNPGKLSFYSCGGVGRGVRILMQAQDYDAETWEAPCIEISNEINKRCGYPPPEEYSAKVVPKRAVFNDGSKGWVAEFPDVPMFRGVNPDSPQRRSMKAWKIEQAINYHVSIALCDGRFRIPEPDEPVQMMLPDDDWRAYESLALQAHFDKYEQKTHIWIISMENPKACRHYAMPMVQLQRRQAWLAGFVPDEMI